MKILFLTLGTSIIASSRTRVLQYLPFLKRGGIKYKVIVSSTQFPYRLIDFFQSHHFLIKAIRFLLYKVIEKYYLIFSGLPIVRFTLSAIFYDILFIQKVLIPTFYIRLLKRVFKKKIVFDCDDAIYADESYNRQRFNQQLSLYDIVILENSFTRQYVNQFTNNDILMITGPIDCTRYHPKEKFNNCEIVIGWIGSKYTTKYLSMIEKMLKRLSAENKNVVIELIGASRILLEGARVRLKTWGLDTEVADLQNFDIGIMPLPDDEWTRGKGGYKLLQYMAVGIPYIASPVGINKELIRDGENGFLANTEEEWYEKLLLLIENSELRKKMGMKGRDLVVKNYSLEVAAPKLISALKELISSRNKSEVMGI